MKTRLLSIIMALTCLSFNGLAQGWQLVWQDEFTNGISSDWVFETGRGASGWGNNELQYYRRENASVENGQLVITAKRESYGGAAYTSARMKTQGKKSWKYGRMEARIAMPSFQGVWPAFWMLGDNISSVGWPNCGEIDIMEKINTDQEVHGTIHWSAANGGYANYGGKTGTSVTAYHTYAVEWNATSIKWFVDGNQYHIVDIANGVNGTSELHNNFFLLLNMAIGGNWPGFSVNNNAFPAKMYVDYVRVYQWGNGPTNPNPGNGVATVYKHCNYDGYAIGLPVGDYNYGALYARGVGNEDISSLKVNPGYQIQLFEHDNFTGASITLTGETSCLVANGWNDRTTSLKIRAGGSSSFTRTIQAESYSAMAGVQTEACNEGGQNVGYIDNGDWMAYNSINFPTSGTYKVEYRVASLYGGGRISLDLNAGSIQLGAVNVPNTGGWQNWTTVSHNVTVNAGTYNVGIFAAAGGFNINWFRITKINAKTTYSSDEEEFTPEYNYSASSINSSSVELYPNPASTTLYLNAGFDLSGSQIKISDVAGREVLTVTSSPSAIDISRLDSGIYTLEVITGETKIFKRFIKN